MRKAHKPKPTSRAGAVLLLLFLAALGGLAGCSGSPPEVKQVFWQLNVVHDLNSGQQYEELSLFVLADDNDGITDLAEIVLFHPDKELVWELEPDEWQQVERDSETWIGTTGVTAGYSDLVPRGEYRVKVSDKAGEYVETSFIVSPDIVGLQRGSLSPDRFPRLRSTTPSRRTGEQPTGPEIVLSERVAIHTDLSEVLVSLYAPDGNFMRSEIIQANPSADDGPAVILQNLQSRWQNAQTVWIQGYRRQQGFGVVSGPYRLR